MSAHLPGTGSALLGEAYNDLQGCHSHFEGGFPAERIQDIAVLQPRICQSKALLVCMHSPSVVLEQHRQSCLRHRYAVE